MDSNWLFECSAWQCLNMTASKCVGRSFWLAQHSRAGRKKEVSKIMCQMCCNPEPLLVFCSRGSVFTIDTPLPGNALCVFNCIYTYDLCPHRSQIAAHPGRSKKHFLAEEGSSWGRGTAKGSLTVWEGTQEEQMHHSQPTHTQPHTIYIYLHSVSFCCHFVFTHAFSPRFCKPSIGLRVDYATISQCSLCLEFAMVQIRQAFWRADQGVVSFCDRFLHCLLDWVRFQNDSSLHYICNWFVQSRFA